MELINCGRVEGNGKDSRWLFCSLPDQILHYHNQLLLRTQRSQKNGKWNGSSFPSPQKDDYPSSIECLLQLLWSLMEEE